MKKDSLGAAFLRGFIKSFLFIAILFGVGFGSYKATMLYYDVFNPTGKTKNNKVIDNIVNDIKVDAISKNLIYRVEPKTGEVTALILEIFNTYTLNLDYITIPVNTQFTMSNDMYQKLRSVNTEIPQIIQLSKMSQYSSKDNCYDINALIIKDLLSADIGYYTVMDEADFDSVFEEKNHVFVIREDFLNQEFKEKQQLEEILSKQYEKVTSNLSIKNKRKYIDKYHIIQPELIHYYNLQGTNDSGQFVIDQPLSKDLVKNVLENKAYTEAQSTVSNGMGQKSSKGLMIEILNGSNISGLAASFQETLTLDGYTVSHIGNYNDMSVLVTTIYVKEDGIGQDLLPYFKGASIETAELSEGTDIQIVLGAADLQK